MLVQCNISMSNIMLHIQYCSLCDRLDLITKSLSALSGCLCILYEISRKTRIYFHEFAFDNKSLETFVKI